MITLTEGTYKTFGNCLTISNGSIEAVVTLEIGPRIIRFGKVGGENVMMEDTAKTSSQEGKEDIFAEKFGEESGIWRIYGGHRLWTSPEELPRTYYPDASAVQYEKLPGGARFVQQPQKWTQIQLAITLTMSENEDKVQLLHEVKNLGAWNIEFSPWALSVLAPGGTEVIPMPQRKTGLLSNRKIVLWDYARMNDDRVYWGDKYITLRQDDKADEAFKIGIDSEHCWAAYFNNGDLFIKKFDSDPECEYPDSGCNFETYTCATFLEMESLGAFKSVAPGEVSTHSEEWSLIADVPYPGCDEDKIAKVMSKYL